MDAGRKSRKAPHDAALLAAACGIVGSEGLAGLTLRPLAEALGVSVTVLTSHYGARADVIAAVCNAACEQDKQLMAEWRGTLAALGTLSPAIAAELAETMLEELATHHRGLSILYLELLHACTWDAALQPVFAAWQAERRGFWQAFGERAGMAPGLLSGGWWHGYILAELAYGLVLGPVTAYRSLRRLCLRRLFAGGLATRADAGDAELFALLLARMQAADGELAGANGAGTSTSAGTSASIAGTNGMVAGAIGSIGTASANGAGSAGREPAWAAQAGRVCGRWLAARGVHGLTHRAVAAEIGIAHTTLSYRYPAQRDLVIAGLESIVAHIRFAVDADSLTELQRLRVEGDGKQLDLARANFAVAIAAARMPELTAYTADMRSRRGNNLVKVFMKYLPQARGIDALCAQVISMGLTGLTNTEPPGEASDQTVAAAFGAAAKWLQQNQ